MARQSSAREAADEGTEAFNAEVEQHAMIRAEEPQGNEALVLEEVGGKDDMTAEERARW